MKLQHVARLSIIFLMQLVIGYEIHFKEYIHVVYLHPIEKGRYIEDVTKLHPYSDSLSGKRTFDLCRSSNVHQLIPSYRNDAVLSVSWEIVNL